MLLLPLNPLLLRNQAPSFTQSWSPLQSSKKFSFRNWAQILCPWTLGLCPPTASSQVPKTDGGQLLAQKYRGNLASALAPGGPYRRRNRTQGVEERAWGERSVRGQDEARKVEEKMDGESEMHRQALKTDQQLNSETDGQSISDG